MSGTHLPAPIEAPEQATDAPPGTVVAAVDLGSNSFHLLVARLAGDEPRVVDRLKQRVALGDGLDESGRLSEEVEERAITCLAGFGQRLRDLHPTQVRAVGTNTFRAARGTARFLRRASEALGHPIEVLPGREEARLIYLGVAHDVGAGGGRRLVIDIGGGSTELILGDGLEPLLLDSLYMGHLGFTKEFFPGGRVTKKRMDRARVAARLELEPVERAYRERGWQTCIGSSGTALAVDAILRESGWSESGITPEGLRQLRRALYAAEHADRLTLPGLKDERKPVLAGGVAILSGLFKALGIDRMTTSEWALREGLLYDLLGRIREDDIRERTIQRMSERFHVDVDQAARVEATALAFLDQVAEPWGVERRAGRQLLSWAARLHEIGIALRYSGYHKHGAYLVENSDLPGFSREDQIGLGALVLTHRRSIHAQAFERLPVERAEVSMRLALLLRLAVALHRARSTTPLPPLQMKARPRALELSFPDGWLERHPLSTADLESEAAAWESVGMRLAFRE